MRSFSKILFAGGIVAFLIYHWLTGNNGAPGNSDWGRARSSVTTSNRAAPTWGNPASLSDHFARHGADFGARDAQEYARMAAELLRRARTEGLPAKLDSDGVLRVFDPRSGAFGAYNRDGTTKTFFKPGNRVYFERQPGRPIDPHTWRWN